MGFSEESRRIILARGDCAVRVFLGGECEGPMHCHHIIPWRERPDLADDPSNGIAVCQRHHPQVEKLSRALRLHRAIDLPPCNHRHPYKTGLEACERKRRERMLARRIAA